MKNHGARQKSQYRRRSHKEIASTATNGRGKKRCHSESSVTSLPTIISAAAASIPETIGSADEDDNNYFDLYNGSYDDDDVFTATNSMGIPLGQSVGEKSHKSTLNLNELSSCLEKIQNTETPFDEVDYSNLFATVEVTNDVDIDKLINSHDYEHDEFVPFEYVKKLMFDDLPSATDCSYNSNQQQLSQPSVEHFYGVL